MLEDERAVLLVHADDLAGVPQALQQLLGERVLDERLDGAAQRAGAVDGIGAPLGDEVARGVGELDGHTLGHEAVAQVGDHELHDAAELLGGERLEDHDLVHAVQELGTEVLLELGHDAALDLLVGEAARALGREAHGGGLGDVTGADVGRHDDDGVGEVDVATLAVGEATFLQDLEQDVEDVGVRLLHLVEEDDRVRAPADGLGELAALVVAHVARGRADELGDGVLLHELGHVEGDERLLGTKEELGERLGELGLAHARGAEEDERAAGATRVLERAAAAPDGLGDLGDRLVLADDALVEHVLGAQELGRLGLGEVGDGHAGHGRDHVGDVLLVHGDHVGRELLAPGVLELVAAGDEGLLLVAQARGVLELLGGRGSRLLLADAGEVGVHLGDLGRERHLVDARARAGLVEHVDGLVG